MDESYDWPLSDTESVTFLIHDPETTWHRLPGVYIFAFQRGDRWCAVYVGRTDEFSTRITNREHWQAAALLGATHIHAQLEVVESVREAISGRLIEHHQPPLNASLG
ncbi:MAG: hypothetical protein IPP94_10460 [Ignavibacteria bacterium]|nr:hypothetical protein [Ignavibacteria bacterium]